MYYFFCINILSNDQCTWQIIRCIYFPAPLRTIAYNEILRIAFLISRNEKYAFGESIY